MTDWYAPNQQAVGVEPAAGGGGTRTAPAAAGFDPADHTVAEVEEHVAANPDQRAAVLKAERKGKNRTTLVDSLEAQSG